MVNPFEPGAQITIERTVLTEDLARFEGVLIHPVYSTYAMARDAEWAGRQFVLQMKEAGEEGIGTYVHLQHLAPAREGAPIRIVATLEEVNGHAVHVSFVIWSGNQKLAEGKTGQKILPKEKIQKLMGTNPS